MLYYIGFVSFYYFLWEAVDVSGGGKVSLNQNIESVMYGPFE